MTVNVRIICNGCKRGSSTYVGSAHSLRMRLVADGWHHGSGGMDWCPECWAEGKQRAS